MRPFPRIIQLVLATGLAIGVACVVQASGAHADQRIVGGERASIVDYPFAVYLADLNGFQFCGGTLVSQTKVITAAHCLVGQRATDLRVVAGREDKQNDAGIVTTVTQFWTHPDFTDVESGSDVAVLTLADRLDYPTATIATNQTIYQTGELSTILALLDGRHRAGRRRHCLCRGLQTLFGVFHGLRGLLSRWSRHLPGRLWRSHAHWHGTGRHRLLGRRLRPARSVRRLYPGGQLCHADPHAPLKRHPR
jgi:hypothetical protein